MCWKLHFGFKFDTYETDIAIGFNSIYYAMAEERVFISLGIGWSHNRNWIDFIDSFVKNAPELFLLVSYLIGIYVTQGLVF